ncbi:hypothetical protein CEXT_787351 [Caerostris extrusa]|uniref:Uncharacterized protein n=1 Tax=Caerostris extrusa TaxID=172846 RepID=A0AAV4VP18_CAEEX|nr:hypothetical protein CEXT_787351 [Caerostris extrusa]
MFVYLSDIPGIRICRNLSNRQILRWGGVLSFELLRMKSVDFRDIFLEYFILLRLRIMGGICHTIRYLIRRSPSVALEDEE